MEAIIHSPLVEKQKVKEFKTCTECMRQLIQPSKYINTGSSSSRNHPHTWESQNLDMSSPIRSSMPNCTRPNERLRETPKAFLNNRNACFSESFNYKIQQQNHRLLRIPNLKRRAHLFLRTFHQNGHVQHMPHQSYHVCP